MFTLFRPHFGIALLLLTLLILPSTASTLPAPDWVDVKDGIICDSQPKLCGISGMALLAQKNTGTEFLVVHDRWAKKEDPVGIVTIGSKGSKSVDYRRLKLVTKGEVPTDLEAITSVPGQDRQFLALTSKGRVFRLAVEDEKAIVKDEFLLPQLQGQPEIEGLSVQQLGGQMVIVWGYRGAGAQPGLFYYALLDHQTRPDDKSVKNCKITVPFPSPTDSHTRHIADLKVDANGLVWASATRDPGLTLVNGKYEDIGPFRSAVYILGMLRVSNTSGKWEVDFNLYANLTRLWVFERKIEAIELVPGPDGGIAFGAEDEDKGGALYFR